METARKLKPTPGPWEAVAKGNKAAIYMEGHSTVIAHTGGLSDEATDRANATLIADAPALLSALRKLVPIAWFGKAAAEEDGFRNVDKRLQAASELIAKYDA